MHTSHLSSRSLGALALDPLLSVVDTAFVGRLGPAPLAGLALSAALLNFTYLALNFLWKATAPLVGLAVSRGDKDGASQVLAQVCACL